MSKLVSWIFESHIYRPVPLTLSCAWAVSRSSFDTDELCSVQVEISSVWLCTFVRCYRSLCRFEGIRVLVLFYSFLVNLRYGLTGPTGSVTRRGEFKWKSHSQLHRYYVWWLCSRSFGLPSSSCDSIHHSNECRFQQRLLTEHGPSGDGCVVSWLVAWSQSCIHDSLNLFAPLWTILISGRRFLCAATQKQ